MALPTTGALSPAARALCLVGGLAIVLFPAPGAAAQPSSATYNQTVLGALLEREAPAPERPVTYAVYHLDHPSGNSIRARHALYRWAGEGDVDRGRERLALTQLIGEPPVEDLMHGDSLILPTRPEDFDHGSLAYAPYPRFWRGAEEIPKAVVVDRSTQTWAGYENGQLRRWGPASTGAAETPTPVGRFTMNWRVMERISSESPPEEEWLMRYVMNIHESRGIHLHQYDVVPTGTPEGHGCVRMVTSDAQWLWEWSDGWQTSQGEGALGARPTAPGTFVLVQGAQPQGAPQRFVSRPWGPQRVLVMLPPDPMAVPRGDR